MVYPWTVTDNVNFIIGYLMGQWKIAIEAFFVICTFINNGKGAVSAGYFIENKYIPLIMVSIGIGCGSYRLIPPPSVPIHNLSS